MSASVSAKEALLGVISFSPQSGYSIKAEMESGGVSYIWDLSFGSIYPRLKDLEREGLITAVEVRDEGRVRTVYDLTHQGWSSLRRWLAEKPSYPLPLRDELLLRMLFWGTARPDDRQTLIGHLRDRAAKTRELLDRLRTPLDENGATDEFQGLIEEYARMRLKAELEWIDKTITQLQGAPRPPLRDPRGIFPKATERRHAAARAAGKEAGPS